MISGLLSRAPVATTDCITATAFTVSFDLILTFSEDFFLEEPSTDPPTECSAVEVEVEVVIRTVLDLFSFDCPFPLRPMGDNTVADLQLVLISETLLSLPSQTIVLLMVVVVLLVVSVFSAKPSLPFKSYLSSPRGEPPGPVMSEFCELRLDL